MSLSSCGISCVRCRRLGCRCLDRVAYGQSWTCASFLALACEPGSALLLKGNVYAGIVRSEEASQVPRFSSISFLGGPLFRRQSTDLHLVEMKQSNIFARFSREIIAAEAHQDVHRAYKKPYLPIHATVASSNLACSMFFSLAGCVGGGHTNNEHYERRRSSPSMKGSQLFGA